MRPLRVLKNDRPKVAFPRLGNFHYRERIIYRDVDEGTVPGRHSGGFCHRVGGVGHDRDRRAHRIAFTHDLSETTALSRSGDAPGFHYIPHSYTHRDAAPYGHSIADPAAISHAARTALADGNA